MIREISKGLYRNYDVLSNVVCYLGNTENDIDQYPNIIEDYETAKKYFTADYIFIRDKFGENKVSQLLPATSDDIQNQSRLEREEYRNLYNVMKENLGDHARDLV